MASYLNQNELVTSAICNKADDRQLNAEEEQAYADLDAVSPIDEFEFRWEKFIEIDVTTRMADEMLPKFQQALLAFDSSTDMTVVKDKRVLRMKFLKVAIAACIVILGTVVVMQYNNPQSPEETEAILGADKGVGPGGFKGTLFLSNNKPILLAEMASGQTLDDGVSTIEKKDSGSLYYTRNSDKINAEARNKLVTPRGGTYTVQLSDGTKVFLNAQSSLEYPVEFIGNTREVTLSGEAYFEVSPGKKPFIVHHHGKEIKVLGTKFNVNTYEKENRLTATLLEGSIELITNNKTIILKPSEQVIVANGNITTRTLTRPENAISWVKGNFSFEKVTLKDIMYQIDRWYDIDVVFEEEPNASPVTIRRVPMNLELSEILDVIKEGDRFSYTITADKQKLIIRK
jgi:hypothetical protein